jgi:hypothetical protein
MVLPQRGGRGVAEYGIYPVVPIVFSPIVK